MTTDIEELDKKESKDQVESKDEFIRQNLNSILVLLLFGLPLLYWTISFIINDILG